MGVTLSKQLVRIGLQYFNTFAVRKTSHIEVFSCKLQVASEPQSIVFSGYFLGPYDEIQMLLMNYLPFVPFWIPFVSFWLKNEIRFAIFSLHIYYV